ncbi:MAG: hypothetical protein LBV51_03110, partial [Acholeplasmatales bacterium]|nr:hypothetical protein [Acholeplasmatales bacterium]
VNALHYLDALNKLGVLKVKVTFKTVFYSINKEGIKLLLDNLKNVPSDAIVSRAIPALSKKL